MFYSFDHTIPKNTTQSDPYEQVVRVTHGVLNKIEIEFPSGCAGLAHLVVFHEEFQLYPANRGGSFATDDFTIQINDYFELFDHPYEFKLQGWNLDDSYDHTITVRFGIIPQVIAEYIYGRRRKADMDEIRRALGLQ